MKSLIRLFSFFIFFSLICSSSYAREVPRKILTLYNENQGSKSIRFSLQHLFAEMPLNHLGYDLHYHSMEEEFPDIGSDYRGVLIWFVQGDYVEKPDEFIDWLEKMVDQGKKLIVIGGLGLPDYYRENPDSIRRLNRLYDKIGMKDTNLWESITYQAEISYQDDDMVGFERSFSESLPPYAGMLALEGEAETYLRVRSSAESDIFSDLVIVSDKGGYISPNYALFEGKSHAALDDNIGDKSSKGISNSKSKRRPQREGGYIQRFRRNKAFRDDVDEGKLLQAVINEEISGNSDSKSAATLDEDDEKEEIYSYQWYINPFMFFSEILDDGVELRPDITTMNGKRVFYSHIDGDGWNSLAEIRKYRRKNIIAADVVYQELLEPYPDIPVTVSIITSDLDASCYGVPVSKDIARKIFQLPHIEAGSHTHSHPLEWAKMDDPEYTKKELSYLNKYPDKPQNTGLYSKLFGESTTPEWDEYFARNPEHKNLVGNDPEINLAKEYDTPRSYACEPFSIKNEIIGSVNQIKELLPEGKEVKLIQWSGDTSPSEAVLRLTKESGFLNINGGDSRYDNEYPSYTSVAPFGLRLGDQIQIYSSNSNENTYTSLWTDRFYGFKFLQSTVLNTGRPRRVAPFNIYYHMYSGQKQASLLAVKENLNFARTMPIIPLKTTDFVKIVNGFYTTQLKYLQPLTWKIVNRGSLNTLRVDGFLDKAVNMEKSKGVLGYIYYQGSIYVSLDPDYEEPVVVLKDSPRLGVYPEESIPYLVESNLKIKSLRFVNKTLIFNAVSFGEGFLKFRMPISGRNTEKYEINVVKGKDVVYAARFDSDERGILEFNIPPQMGNEVAVTVSKM